MKDLIIIETIVQIVATLLLTLIGVLGTWLSMKLAKRAELTNISIAANEAPRPRNCPPDSCI